jgi:hypothetical protein
MTHRGMTHRKEPSKLAEMMRSPYASFTLFHKYDALVVVPGISGGVPEGAFGWLRVAGPYARLEKLADEDVGCIFLGLGSEGGPHFALNLTDAGREGVAALLEDSAEVCFPASPCLPRKACFKLHGAFSPPPPPLPTPN